MSAIITLPTDAASPEAVSVDRTASSLPRKPVQQAVTELCSARPPWATSSKWEKPVAPFVVASCPAPPVSTQTDRHCLAADTAGLPPAFYSEHTPRLTRLKHQADKPGTGYHTGRMSPSPVIHVHHTIGHVA